MTFDLKKWYNIYAGGRMNGNLYQIIEQIQKDLFCPVCGKNYQVGEIRLRGLFDHTLVIQTICVNGHVTLFMTSYQKKEKLPKIITNDVIDLHKELRNFNGDFKSEWKL